MAIEQKLHFVSAPYPGTSRWLREGSKLDLWGYTELGDLETRIPDADVYGLGAWHDAYQGFFTQAKHAGKSVGIAWSSSPQESDTGRTQIELAYLQALTKPDSPVRADWWACLHPSLTTILPNAIHLPAPIFLETPQNVDKKPWLGMFMPATEKKALFSQLIAVRNFQHAHPNITLQTNLKTYRPIIDWLGIKTQFYDWLPREQYLLILAQCQVAMHASLAESFGYSGVDALMVGTPVIGSPTMGWLPSDWCAADANDPASIRSVLERVWGEPDAAKRARRVIEEVAQENNTSAEVAVEQILDMA